MKVGEKIQRIRKERGYTADQLAEMHCSTSSTTKAISRS